MERENIIVTKTLDFSLDIIAFCEQLESNKKFVIANQLLKSGMSIGANIYEAQNAESRADFIHKVKIAAKEIEETSIGYCCANVQLPIHSTKTSKLKLMK